MEVARSCHPHEVPDLKRRRVIAESEAKQKAPQSALQLTSKLVNANPIGYYCLNNSRRSLEVDQLTSENALSKHQALYLAWREVEQRQPGKVFGLSFDECLDVEQIRLSAIDSIFCYVRLKELSQSTLHLASHYTHRLFHYYMVEKAAENVPRACLYTAVATALRTAVKIQERWEHTEPFRLHPEQLWVMSGIANNDSSIDKSVKPLNQMEKLHIKILADEPIYMPVAADFLEQYLDVGGWPECSVREYRRLALFLLALSLFSSGGSNALQGVVPSKVAAAALILAVKIINTDTRVTAYEFWTQKLETFTQYTVKELQPVVHALSRLLRRQQAKVKSEVFSAMFPVWSKFSWS